MKKLVRKTRSVVPRNKSIPVVQEYDEEVDFPDEEVQQEEEPEDEAPDENEED